MQARLQDGCVTDEEVSKEVRAIEERINQLRRSAVDLNVVDRLADELSDVTSSLARTDIIEWERTFP